MKRVIRRVLFVVAGVAGLVAVAAGPAAAGTNLNHVEPRLAARRRTGAADA